MLDWHTHGPDRIATSNATLTAVVVKHSEVRYTWAVFESGREIDSGVLLGEGDLPGTAWGECRRRAERCLLAHQSKAAS